MLISRRYKFIFLSNPKCGSSTFREILSVPADLAAPTLSRIAEGKERKEEVGKMHTLHWNAFFLKNSIDLARKKTIEDGASEEETMGWDDYYSFTTVRNPYKRLASWYFFLKPDINFRTFQSDDYDEDTAFHHHFNDFIEEYRSNTKMAKLPDHTLFCYDWDNQGTNLVNDIFKIEDINDTFSEKFKEKTGLEVPTPIPRFYPDHKQEYFSRYESYNGNYYDLYNENSKQAVAEMYAKDIEKFNYEFGQ